MEILNNYQKKLFPYAYNILGSADDALDVIQEVMGKYFAAYRQGINDETNYLIKAVINLSINTKKRNQKIVAGDVWLPEPIATERADENINRDEILSYSMLVLLEYLNPKERAVFILKETFEYSHDEIAEALSITVENSRKLLSRAKGALKKTGNNFRLPTFDASAFLNNYISLIKNGDTTAIEQLLTQEIAIKTDGGKHANVVRKLTTGVGLSAKHLVTIFNTFLKTLTVVIGDVNHQPALFFYKKNILINCQVFEFDDDGTKIKSIYAIVDPKKLSTFNTF
jgi:RNA polymerase sigma factor (sigma-70 family)